MGEREWSPLRLDGDLHAAGLHGLVTAEQMREWLNTLRQRGNRPATVNTRYRGVCAFYKWLRKEGKVRENPLERIEPPGVPETVQPYYVLLGLVGKTYLAF
jgi:site-specific recombinase XerC